MMFFKGTVTRDRSERERERERENQGTPHCQHNGYVEVDVYGTHILKVIKFLQVRDAVIIILLLAAFFFAIVFVEGALGIEPITISITVTVRFDSFFLSSDKV